MEDRKQANWKKWLILINVGFGAFLCTLNSSIMNTILPTIEQDLQIQRAQSSWLVLIFLLVLTATLVPIGRLSDLIGHRTLFLLGFLFFTCAAFLCGFSKGFWPLLLGRALLALGGSMILSVGPAIITTTFPPEQRGRMLGLQAFMTYIGLSLGPVLGGAITQLWGWHYTFFLTLPFSLGGLLLALWIIPRISGDKEKSVDYTGISLFVAAMASMTLFLNSEFITSRRGFYLSLLFLVFLVTFCLFLRTERRAPAPMIQLSLFRIRNFGFGSLGAAANYLSFYLVLFVVPFYCREILNLNAMQTGAYLTIMPVLMMLSAPISGALSDRFGSRVFSMLGMLITTVSLALLGAAARPAATPSIYPLVISLLLAGLGSGFFVVPNNSAIMGAASRSQQGVASGVLATFRYLGMIAGTTVGGSLFDMIEKLLMAGGAGESTAFRVSFTVTMGVGVLFGILGFLCASAMSKKAKAE